MAEEVITLRGISGFFGPVEFCFNLDGCFSMVGLDLVKTKLPLIPRHSRGISSRFARFYGRRMRTIALPSLMTNKELLLSVAK